jgi:23S rRNA (guanosine2251-2'-O)-methyltransferase
MKKTPVSEMKRLSADEFKASVKMPVVVVLDDVRSAYNVGSVFRTADAFRVTAVHLCGISAPPPHKEISKTALGATESVDWQYFEDAATSLALLKKDGYEIVAVEQADPSIKLSEFPFKPGQKIALIFGHEVTGVSEKALSYAGACIEIPQYGTKHSMNIAVTVGIVLYEAARQLEIRN